MLWSIGGEDDQGISSPPISVRREKPRVSSGRDKANPPGNYSLRPDEQYAYRAKRNAHDAVREVQWLNRGLKRGSGRRLSGYFDTIPHPQLLKSLARRISDGSLMRLLKQWLQMPVEESDGRGGKRRSNPARRQKRGTPISPLLSNLYMRRVLRWKSLGYGERLQARIVNYADDFVILCRKSGEQAYAAMSALMGQLGLRVKTEKTRLCKVPEESSLPAIPLRAGEDGADI